MEKRLTHGTSVWLTRSKASEGHPKSPGPQPACLKKLKIEKTKTVPYTSSDWWHTLIYINVPELDGRGRCQNTPKSLTN